MHGETNAPRDAGLVRAMGPWTLAASLVNIVVGGGIFVAPSSVAASAGPFAPLVFLTCAMVVGAVAVCFAEGGSRVPTSGGPYGYIEVAFGPFAAYVSGVLVWVSDVLALGGIAAALADAAVTVLPSGLRAPAHPAVIVCAVGAIALVNVGGVRRGAALASAATAVKLLPLLVFVGVGAAALRRSALLDAAVPGPSGIGRAFLLVTFTFMGMETVLGASGEVADPTRTIPRALAISTGFVALLFTAIQVVAQGLLGPALARSPVPLADALGTVHPILRSLMIAGAAISMLGWIGSDLLGSPRLLFALAREGRLPRALARVHPRTHAPHVAILTHAAIAIGLALTGTFTELAVLSALFTAPLYVAGCAASWRLARTRVARAGAPLQFRGLGPAAATGIAGMLATIALGSWKEMVALASALAICAGSWVVVSRRASTGSQVPGA